ncbi:hypothetical protein [Roseateles violae]|uniref:Uncharacterized protein n=1 Tax=Roseateles violae TaxID=3058042 RepID=A0ABT8DX02_9BURK|nr:hypothetical protein [Pelomonas sp. PFR6]MDN3921092.1 hypothetical protein [Pelomonas sp. PFR6]
MSGDLRAAPVLTRLHRTRLMQVWRSAGWPCRDGIEIDLLAAQLLEQRLALDGRETLALTEAGIALLARSRQQGQRALSAHDRLAQRFAAQLSGAGRIVWRELSLRALVEEGAAPAGQPPLLSGEPLDAAAVAARNVWRMARPDLFSVRNTTVEAYLQPMVHEIKASRADLLSDLRHAAKRQAYQWLCSECYYVFPAGVAEAEEIPEQFGVWVLHGELDAGRFELLRPARHSRCSLPFAVWLALAKATPWSSDEDASPQAALGDERP